MVLGNPTGGRRQGAVDGGLFSFAVGVDLGRLAGPKGTTDDVSVFQIHGGPGVSARDIGNFDVVSGLENERDSGLCEAWIRQALGDAFDVRAGRMSADEEFLIADRGDRRAARFLRGRGRGPRRGARRCRGFAPGHPLGYPWPS